MPAFVQLLQTKEQGVPALRRKVSKLGLSEAADQVLEGAKKMRWLQGVPGVMQGEGSGFAIGEKAYAVMRQELFVAFAWRFF